MREKLTKNQARVLALTNREGGITKGHILGRDWRVIDRLETLGLCEVVSANEAGRRYAITPAGRAALKGEDHGQ